MKELVPTIKSEIAELESDIRKNPDPRVRKIERLRSTLAEYEPGAYVPQSNGKTAPLDPGLLAKTKVARMKGYIDGALQNRLKVHRKSLLEGLIANGIMGKEANPMQALAIFLSSNKDDYESDGEGNYSRRGG